MTLLALDVASRPGLAYQYAFDWLAVHLHSKGEPWARAVAPGVMVR